MTATRDPDRLIRAWLDLMPDEAPDRAIAAVLQAAETTRQVRMLPRFGPRRSPMNRLTLIAAVAVIVLALVGGAYLLAGGRNGPAPVTPTATPAPTPGATPIATTADAIAPMPEALWGDWLAEADPIPGIVPSRQLIQLSVNWDGGRTTWIQTTTDEPLAVESSSIAAAPGELLLRSDVANHGCTFGDDGRYRWTAAGMFLTLELISDACQARGVALARTWVRSLGAVNDGGSGVTYSTTPMIQVTVPRGQRLGASSGDQWHELKTYGNAEPFQAFVVVGNPGGFGAPCSKTDLRKQSIAPTTAAFVAYVEGLPGASVAKGSTEVGGKPAVRLDVSIDPNVDCARGSIEAFHPENPADTFQWAFSPGELQRMYIVEMGADRTFLVWYQGTSEEEQAVIGSVQFLDTLPTR
jgi:hypothetical protein